MSEHSPLTIQARITCPHCWHEYAPEESFYVAEHPDLTNDVRLGPGIAQRFLPSRFTPDCDALDPNGTRTNRLACPNCHLEVARALYQIPPIFFSILGQSFSGKSYFMAAMTWALRKVLPSKFAVTFIDTDPVFNARLHEYEELLFMNPNPDEYASLKKTEEDGDLYDQVKFDSQSIRFPKPFLFNLQPAHHHPERKSADKQSRVICMYDNAGESFLPGNDGTNAPVTRHLALARCLFFLFDPTQDPRFREKIKGKTTDQQMLPRSTRFARENSVRQDTVLLEAIQRVRRHAGLRDDALAKRRIVIVVTKWDAWKNLLPDLLDEDGSLPASPLIPSQDGKTTYLDGKRIVYASQCLERLFRETAPEIVSAAEGFASELLFLPASGLGHSPTDIGNNNFVVKPAEIEPAWVEIPILYALSKHCPELIGMVS